jgi:hypothetical protein
MTEDGGTYLEDFILSLEFLPNDVRRDFELVSNFPRKRSLFLHYIFYKLLYIFK